MDSYTPSVRAQILTRRTYNRPLDERGTRFETWDQTVDRVLDHQRWLWERAQGDTLTADQAAELTELAGLVMSRAALPAGRTLWLGGTELVRRREASNFNCSFLEVRTVHDVVDAFWLLLQGCGVGFKPVTGTLSGFTRRMEVEVIRSTRASRGGRESNLEFYDPTTRTWTIEVGDSAEAWAKSAGKVVAGKFPARRIVFDFSEVRPPGERLRGYGWICCGDGALAKAFLAISGIMNRQAGKLLAKQDIWDIVNWLGTVLSNRRSAQIGLVDADDPEARSIAAMKPPGFWAENPQRAQSNNSLAFFARPTARRLRDLFDQMAAHGGGEPGFLNASGAIRRAPWCKGLNPCGEILLSDKGFCNLSEIDLARFRGDHLGLHRAAWLVARANYRQTLVELRDGVLQDAWHQNNQYLRLCGVGITGIVRRPDLTPYDFRQLRNAAVAGAYSMADELGLERPKNVTTVKPSGSLSKIMDTTEGCHRPLGRYIFNNVSFNRHDPLLARLCDAGYRLFDHPTDPDSVLATFPVAWDDVEFGDAGGKSVNVESAIVQLERYRLLMDAWCDQNVSCTVSYDRAEIPAMVKWFERHWDSCVGVSFLFRNDPTKTAADLGFAYLPQEVVTEAAFREYAARLRAVDLDAIDLGEPGEVDAGPECSTGACPVR
jgi:adenosylcobalamin-dependent ribonucleoside-triphosphate reductase